MSMSRNAEGALLHFSIGWKISSLCIVWRVSRGICCKFSKLVNATISERILRRGNLVLRRRLRQGLDVKNSRVFVETSSSICSYSIASSSVVSEDAEERLRAQRRLREGLENSGLSRASAALLSATHRVCPSDDDGLERQANVENLNLEPRCDL